MSLSRTALSFGFVFLVLSILVPQARAISPVDAVRFQLEHEFAAGRVAPDFRDELMELLDEVKEDFQSGDETDYRIHVDSFREKVRNGPSTEIQSDAADRILSVARSLQ